MTFPDSGFFDIGAHECKSELNSSIDNLKKSFFQIQTNPILNGVLTINMLHTCPSKYSFMLVDKTGKKIILDQLKLTVNEKVLSLDVANITSGMYWLILYDGKTMMQSSQILIYN